MRPLFSILRDLFISFRQNRLVAEFPEVMQFIEGHDESGSNDPRMGGVLPAARLP